MNVVIEFNTKLLVEKSKELWDRIAKDLPEFRNGVAVLEDYLVLEGDELAAVKAQIPWVSGKVGCIMFEPGAACPIHCDDHEGVLYKRSLNFLVESDGDNHATRYYEYKHGYWDPKKYNALYQGDPNDLTKIFEFTVKEKPVLFFNQILHDVYNYGKTRRVMIMWLIEQSVTDQEVFDWANKNNIDTEVLFKCG